MTHPTRDRGSPQATLAVIDGDAPMLDCGHGHRHWSPIPIPTGAPRGWVVAKAIPVGSLVLDAGSPLQLDVTDCVLQGCAGCEDFFVWSRFRVLGGSMAGQCVEFLVIDPMRHEQPVIPPNVRASFSRDES